MTSTGPTSALPVHHGGRQRAAEIKKVAKVYSAFIYFNFVLMFVSFLEPVFNRATTGGWKRGIFVYYQTLSLDAHALVGLIVLFLFPLQFTIGRLQWKHTALRPLHRWLGRVLFVAIYPVFIIGGIWTTVDRAYRIPAEKQLFFATDRFHLVLILCFLLVFMLLLGIRTFKTIRGGDILGHLDSIIAFYVLASVVALERLILYLLVWIFGSPPITLSFLALTTSVIMLVEFNIAGKLAGRVRETARLSSIYVATLVLVFVVDAPNYHLFH